MLPRSRYNSSGLFGIHWRTRALAPQFAALFAAGWSDGPEDVASFYKKWCAAEFGGGGSLEGAATVPAATVAAACAPFLKLDAQVCSGNCADLNDYPAHCGDPGLPTSYKSESCLRPSVWSNQGQGAFVADPIQCGNDHLYDWVETFVKLDLSAGGAAVTERHQYWSGQFEVMRSFSAGAQAFCYCLWRIFPERWIAVIAGPGLRVGKLTSNLLLLRVMLGVCLSSI